MNEWKRPSILFWLFTGAHYCSNRCWVVLNLGICPRTGQLSTFSNHRLWYITMVREKNLKVKESWVLSWKSLVLWGFWNNPNWLFIYSKKKISKTWNWPGGHFRKLATQVSRVTCTKCARPCRRLTSQPSCISFLWPESLGQLPEMPSPSFAATTTFRFNW